MSRLRRRRCAWYNEELESRMLLAALTPAQVITPAQMAHAYGVDQIKFGSTVGDGTGQTIAIIDAYDAPNIVTDLAAFDTNNSLPNTAGGGGTLLTIHPMGTLGIDSTNTWATETTLDVEWAHAIAPGANILLVQAVNSGLGSLLQAVDYARNQAGVSVVSMSWGAVEGAYEFSADSYLTTPTGHAGGVSFVASTGDTGGAIQWPAESPNAVAVGGTTLRLTTLGGYGIETTWSSSGGGVSQFESAPAFQSAITGNSSRSAPDVAWDANPTTGVDLVFNGSTVQVGGTSLSAPCWAAVVAIADEGRVLAGKSPLDGPTQLLPALYAVPANNFHDITLGTAGPNSAKPGYDLVTGRGSPYADRVVASLVNANFSGSSVTFAPATFTTTAVQTTTLFVISNSADSSANSDGHPHQVQIFVGGNGNHENGAAGDGFAARYRSRLLSFQIIVSVPTLTDEIAT